MNAEPLRRPCILLFRESSPPPSLLMLNLKQLTMQHIRQINHQLQKYHVVIFSWMWLWGSYCSAAQTICFDNADRSVVVYDLISRAPLPPVLLQCKKRHHIFDHNVCTANDSMLLSLLLLHFQYRYWIYSLQALPSKELVQVASWHPSIGFGVQLCNAPFCRGLI